MAPLHTMGGLEFERFVGDLYSLQGYAATLTPSTSDHGADIILERDGQKVAVQTKRQISPVGNQAIRDVHAAKTTYRADHACVVTTAEFTHQAREAARTLGVELVGGPQLRVWLEKLTTEEWITILGVWPALEPVATPATSTPEVQRRSSGTRQSVGQERREFIGKERRADLDGVERLVYIVSGNYSRPELEAILVRAGRDADTVRSKKNRSQLTWALLDDLQEGKLSPDGIRLPPDWEALLNSESA